MGGHVLVKPNTSLCVAKVDTTHRLTLLVIICVSYLSVASLYIATVSFDVLIKQKHLHVNITGSTMCSKPGLE